MVSCTVCGATRTPKHVQEGITFHHFPKNKNQHIQWTSFVNKEKWTPTRYSVICSQHFTTDSFDRTSSIKVRLKPTAVPTIEVKRLKYVRVQNPDADKQLLIKPHIPKSNKIQKLKDEVQNQKEEISSLKKLKIELIKKNIKLKRRVKVLLDHFGLNLELS